MSPRLTMQTTNNGTGYQVYDVENDLAIRMDRSVEAIE